MQGCNETITLFNARRDGDTGGFVYLPTVIAGCSWHRGQRVAIDAEGGLAAAALISKKEGTLHPVWLIPVGDTRHAFAVSVAYSRESVAQQFLLLRERLEAMRLSQAENTAVTHCVEEMMLHQLEMGQSCGLRGSFDVGIVDGDDRFTILVKAAGKAFNPLHAYGKNDPEALSLRIVEGFCRDVNYRYASGVNCVYLNFDKISACHPAAAGPRGR